MGLMPRPSYCTYVRATVATVMSKKTCPRGSWGSPNAMPLPRGLHERYRAQIDRIRHAVAHRHAECRDRPVRLDHRVRLQRLHVREPRAVRELAQERGVSLDVHRASLDTH